MEKLAQIQLFNFEIKDEKFNISLNLDGEYKLTEYTLDKDTSALHNWVKLGTSEYPNVL